MTEDRKQKAEVGRATAPSSIGRHPSSPKASVFVNRRRYSYDGQETSTGQVTAPSRSRPNFSTISEAPDT